MRAKPRKNESWFNQARKHRVFPLLPSVLISEINIDFCRLGQGGGMRKGMLLFALLTNIKLLIYQPQQKHCRGQQCLHGRICRKIRSEAFLLNQKIREIILISASPFLTGPR